MDKEGSSMSVLIFIHKHGKKKGSLIYVCDNYCPRLLLDKTEDQKGTSYKRKTDKIEEMS
jgi:hypothetical protein